MSAHWIDCPRCGSRVAPDAQSCGSCGHDGAAFGFVVHRALPPRRPPRLVLGMLEPIALVAILSLWIGFGARSMIGVVVFVAVVLTPALATVALAAGRARAQGSRLVSRDRLRLLVSLLFLLCCTWAVALALAYSSHHVLSVPEGAAVVLAMLVAVAGYYPAMIRVFVLADRLSQPVAR